VQAGRGVLIDSTYRRLQRFFQHVDLDPDWPVAIVARLIGTEPGSSGPWTLALDRTTWKIGTRDVNDLVLAVITPRFRVPLMWSLIEGPGCSATADRIALMRRYLDRFPASTVRLLLADRAFIGAEWLEFLNDHNTPSRSACATTCASPPRTVPNSPCAPASIAPRAPGSSRPASACAPTPTPDMRRC
jgi:hypothetical protein